MKVSHLSGDIAKRLLQREAFWMFYLKTMSPSGLNDDFDISCFLVFVFFIRGGGGGVQSLCKVFV